MANKSNGHVVIGIDGDASEFESEIKSVERSAKSAASALGHEYAKAGSTLQDGMRKAWAEVRRAQRDGTTVTINGVETIISKNEQLIGQKNRLGDVYDDIGASSRKAALNVKAGLADIKAGIDMTVAAARALGGVVTSGVQYTANIEQLKTSFEVMTGSAEKAAEVVNRLRTMAAETPFEMADLAGVTQLLMQYGFTADEAIEKMRMLGDIAQGNSEAMRSIAMGYAQMASAGKVNLQDIKQMINGGFNPLQEISERTGESMASLYDRISKGKMSVDEITQSMRYATSEGGKFFGSMDKQSKTLSGQLSTLKDNADQLLGSLTQGLSDDLRDELLPLANNMISTLQEAFDQRGMEGLLSAATDMLPSLLDMMTGRMEDSISALSKFAPKAVTAIMSSIPGAIRSGSAVLPQITSALFDVAGLVVSELVTMLPELVPSVISGFAGLLNESINGIGKLLNGFYSGIEQAAHKGQKKIAGVWVDQKDIAKYDFSVDVGDIDTETPANEVKTGLDTVLQKIGEKLTDGISDDSETVKTLEAQVRSWAQDAYGKISGWYDDEVEKLNASGTTGAEYDAKLLEIETKANEMRDGVQAAEVSAIEFLTSMAGKSTEYVQQHLNELTAIGEAAEGIIKQIDQLTNEARTAAENAFQVVRSGASADEATVSAAIKFKFTEFSLDTQAAEDTYAAAVKELNAQFAAGEITKDEYNDLTSEKAAELESAKAGAKAAYEQAFSEILKGVAEASGEGAAFEAAASDGKLLARQLLITAFNSMQEVGWDGLGADTKQGIADAMTVLLDEAWTVAKLDESGQAGVLMDQLISQYADYLDPTLLEGKIGNVFQQALEQGMLIGTSFDTADEDARLETLLVSIAMNGIAAASPQIEEASSGLGDAAADGMENYSGGYASGGDTSGGFVDGLLSMRERLLMTVRSLARDVQKAYNRELQIESPSKVMMQAGRYTGQGLEIGLRESMAKAADVARRVTGQIATAADISQNMRVNIPTLQQDIMIANEQMPIKLYVNGREFAQTTATDTNRAQNGYKRSIALGVGK